MTIRDFSTWHNTDLEGWWRADQGITKSLFNFIWRIDSWADQSGNGRTMLPPTTGQRPIYANTWTDHTGSTHNSVQFNSANSHVLRTAIGTDLSGSDKPYTVAIAFNYVTSSNRGTLFGLYDASTTQTDHTNAETDKYNSYRYDGTSSATVASGTVDQSHHRLVKVFKGTSCEVFVDGTSVASGSYDVGMCGLVSASLGATRGGTNYADIHVVEAVVWKGAFSTTDVTDVNATLTSRWF